MPFKTAGPGHQIRKGGKQLFVFDLNVLDDSSRKVFGIATGPQLDRENETILKAAIEKALPNFMMLPIMHLDHTERPVGWFTKAEFRGQDLYVEACVKPTSDCDEFWQDVRKASSESRPYQFSIFGDRVECTPSCALDPQHRTEPCITKALDLYSISICQPGTAINPNTFAEVMKAMNLSTTQGPRKATDSASNMIHPTTDGKYPKKGSTMVPEPEEKKPQMPVRDSGNGPSQEELPGADNAGDGDGKGRNTDAVIELLTQVVERLQSLESSLGLYKAKPEDEMAEKKPDDEEKEVVKCPVCAKKAEVPAAPQETTITKADLGRIAKAEERLGAIEGKLDLIMKSMARGLDVVVLDPALNKAMAKDEQGNMAPIEKSAGAAQVANFGKLFK